MHHRRLFPNAPLFRTMDDAKPVGRGPWLLKSYFRGPVPATERARMVIYKAMCDLLWTLWGLIQRANGNSPEDFKSCAEGRFARCKALMATPDFARQLAVLSR